MIWVILEVMRWDLQIAASVAFWTVNLGAEIEL